VSIPWDFVIPNVGEMLAGGAESGTIELQSVAIVRNEPFPELDEIPGTS